MNAIYRLFGTGSRRPGARRLLQIPLLCGISLLPAGFASADTLLISNGSPVRVFVPADDSLGGTWRNRSFDDSSWTAGQNGVGYEVNPGAFSASVIADSAAEWSTGGRHGENSWINGYYDLFNDADATYQASDFQPFPRADGPNGPTNFWTGSGWDWFNGNPPWDFIGPADVHPNGSNQPQGIHWVIRRWVSTASGDITIRFHVRKANAAGAGVTGKIFKNGAELFTRAISGTDATGFEVYVNTTAAVGDVFDFAHTPGGPGGDTTDGSDGSVMTATVLSGTIAPPPVTELANSETDWSAAGVQGENGWFYGYYDRGADVDMTYDPNTDFNMTDPNWTFTGGAWQLGTDGNPTANPPWDNIGQTGWHPNGDNQAQGIHWVIRRWVSDTDGDMYIRVVFAKANANGNGTTLHVLHNGTEVFTWTTNGTVGIDTIILLPNVLIGDRIEFALDPLGTDGLFADGADSSTLRAAIFTGTPPPPFVPGIADCFTADVETAMRGVNPSVFIRIPFDVADPALIESLKLKIKYNDGFAAYLNGTEIVKRNAPTTIAGITVADSIADWSTDPNVVVNGWSYGYYSQSLDADGTYSGGPDFSPFPHDGGGPSATDFWNGNGYDWFMGNPPWTELFQETTHPNAPNANPVDPGNPGTHVHWTIRRWSATVDANLKARIRFRKTNPNCGDGVQVAVFHNSTQVYSETIAANDATGRDDTIDLPDVFLGDTIDVLLGPGDAGNDNCDGSAFSVVIFEGEPSIPWNGAATDTRTPTQTIAPETFDLTDFISNLQAGPNLLAIQGFNGAVDDNEFVINAELLANQVPTAADDSLTAAPETTTTFPAAALLGNDADPDNDPLLLVGVTPTYMTDLGGTVRLFGDTVQYTPAAAFTGTDTFEYTITDRSGIPVRAFVSVLVEEGADVLLSVVFEGDGVTITWPFPSSGLFLESTGSLSAPDWQPVEEISNDGNTWRVHVELNQPERYFRLRAAP